MYILFSLLLFFKRLKTGTIRKKQLGNILNLVSMYGMTVYETQREKKRTIMWIGLKEIWQLA